MNDSLRDLYQEVILDHNRRPRNFGPLPEANRQAEGYNPLCGDRVTVFLDIEDDHIRDLRFEGAGCAISTASASLMTEALKGLSVEEARSLFHDFHELVTTGAGENSPEFGAGQGPPADRGDPRPVEWNPSGGSAPDGPILPMTPGVVGDQRL